MTAIPTEALMQQAQSRPESRAFIFNENVWTYRRLAHESERVARGLAAIGVDMGQHVIRPLRGCCGPRQYQKN
jgi:long-chain acyl-CoA synthetase